MSTSRPAMEKSFSLQPLSLSKTLSFKKLKIEEHVYYQHVFLNLFIIIGYFKKWCTIRACATMQGRDRRGVGISLVIIGGEPLRGKGLVGRVHTHPCFYIYFFILFYLFNVKMCLSFFFIIFSFCFDFFLDEFFVWTLLFIYILFIFLSILFLFVIY